MLGDYEREPMCVPLQVKDLSLLTMSLKKLKSVCKYQPLLVQKVNCCTKKIKASHLISRGMRDREINCEIRMSCGIMLVTGYLPKVEL